MVATANSLGNHHQCTVPQCAPTTSTTTTSAPRPHPRPWEHQVITSRPTMRAILPRIAPLQYKCSPTKAGSATMRTMTMMSLDSLIFNHWKTHTMARRKYKHMLRILSNPTSRTFFKYKSKCFHLLLETHSLAASMITA